MRVDLLQTDVNKDKESMDNLRSHIKALRDRIENIKKTKQLTELQAQFSEYQTASDALTAQAKQLTDVKSALESKMNQIKSEKAAAGLAEMTSLKDSLGGAGGEAGGE